LASALAGGVSASGSPSLEALTMPSEFDFKRAFVKLIERTEDPIGPIKLQECHRWVEAVGKMLARPELKEEATIYTKALTSYWPDDDELNKICGSPGFIVALCLLLSQSLVEYAKETHDGVRDDKTI
jgi:hypothetical protein